MNDMTLRRKLQKKVKRRKYTDCLVCRNRKSEVVCWAWDGGSPVILSRCKCGVKRVGWTGRPG